MSGSVRTCGSPIVQYSWQDADRVGREEIAQAIYDAEKLIASYTSFDVGIGYHEDEPTKVGYNGHAYLENKYVRAFGVRTKDLVAADHLVTYFDLDTDGYAETARVVVAGSSPEDEYHIYYPGHEGDDAWEIPTTRVIASGGNVTITTRRERLVLEALLEGFEVEEVSGIDNALFLTTVDVYRVHYPTDNAIKFISRCCCTCSCEEITTYGCGRILDSRTGLVALSPSTCTGTLCTPWPDTKVSYRAGIQGQEWERVVAYLTLAQLDRNICTCPRLDATSKFWRTDMAVGVSTSGRSTRAELSNRKLGNPLGTTRAGIYAWEWVQRNHVYAGLRGSIRT